MKAALHNRDFVLIISMCLIMVFGFFSTIPAFAVNANQTHTVTVKTGDTLWAIASKEVGEDTDIRSAILGIKVGQYNEKQDNLLNYDAELSKSLKEKEEISGVK